jgi:arginyl-tRNA--protein-N-Asp/Glu arginylyltransferase
MRAEPTVRLFQTLPHACGYYADRTAQNLVVDPAAPQLDKLYGPALEQGFRRAGGHLYFPQCPQCQACTPCRVNVEDFQPDRSQRRSQRHRMHTRLQPRTARAVRNVSTQPPFRWRHGRRGSQ